MLGFLLIAAHHPSDDAEVISGPRRVQTKKEDPLDFGDFTGVVDTGALPPRALLDFGFLERFHGKCFPTFYKMYSISN